MLYLILVRSKLAEARDVGILPAIKKKWMSMCTHLCCMPHGIAGETPTSLTTIFAADAVGIR